MYGLLAGLNRFHENIERHLAEINAAAIPSHSVDDDGGWRIFPHVEEELGPESQAMVNDPVDVCKPGLVDIVIDMPVTMRNGDQITWR
ncbi:hypothetical protein CCS41_14840 (plasmid) [Candidatus Fukatsuia symbiotica]|uniref:Uncharacterized protein n=1 Tax=Candidatus Fukatsuia symbiotica TaxID=1878942 RepID=A0A2Y9CKK5_9GAMM|nr:hypothetical protein CCS41_14770 [Candidatus Fukatsuia symbiotica]AWK15679.1 hypothetical protein CCS41_14840 [Candidatus Fukatsuia symbiotica]